MRRQILLAAKALMVAGWCLLHGACAGGFEAKWREAASRPPPDPYSGRWAGEWKSTRGTHRGALECVFTRVNPRVYQADFHAHWHGLASSYSVPFTTETVGDRLRFQGEHDLGAVFGGVYRYRGEISASRFQAAYDSRYDSGVFELGRVPARQ